MTNILNLRMIITILIISFGTTTYGQAERQVPPSEHRTALQCVQPSFLKKGDKVALISPAYFTPMENVTKTASLLRSWGLEPIIGPNVGKVSAGKYAGTDAERVSDLRWALHHPEVKAIICNRGGYGTIHLIDSLALQEWSLSPKWLVGFSDITTLLGLLNRSGVMGIHGTMSSLMAKDGTDATTTLMRDLLMGQVPCYELPAHPANIIGRASGVLVGGNICTFAPNLGSNADATQASDLILFIEEVEESMHNLDRQLNILKMNGVLDRCKGIVLGEFTGCGKEFTYESVEQMFREYFLPYGFPVLCGFPGGHGDVNLPLVMGAPVTIDVRNDGATLEFHINGQQHKVNTADN